MSTPDPGRVARIVGLVRSRADTWLAWGGVALALLGFALPVKAGRPGAELAAEQVLYFFWPLVAAEALALWTAVLGPAVAVALRAYGRPRAAWAGGAAGLCAAGGCLASMVWTGARPGVGIVLLGAANVAVLATALVRREAPASASSPWRPIRAGAPTLAAVVLGFVCPDLAPRTLCATAGLLATYRPPGWALACDAAIALGDEGRRDPRPKILEGIHSRPGPDALAAIERWIVADVWWWSSREAGDVLIACGGDPLTLARDARPEIAVVGVAAALSHGHREPELGDVAAAAVLKIARPARGWLTGALAGLLYQRAGEEPLFRYLDALERATGTAPPDIVWAFGWGSEVEPFVPWLVDARRGVRVAARLVLMQRRRSRILGVAGGGMVATDPFGTALHAYDPDAPPDQRAAQADTIRAALGPAAPGK